MRGSIRKMATRTRQISRSIASPCPIPETRFKLVPRFKLKPLTFVNRKKWRAGFPARPNLYLIAITCMTHQPEVVMVEVAV